MKSAPPKLPSGMSRRGADMGRHSSPGHRPDGSPWDPKDRYGLRGFNEEAFAHPRTFHLRKIGPDGDGYDEGGAYWGLGDPVWWAHDEETEANLYVRATSRDEAKRMVRAVYPNGSFHTLKRSSDRDPKGS